MECVFKENELIRYNTLQRKCTHTVYHPSKKSYKSFSAHFQFLTYKILTLFFIFCILYNEFSGEKAAHKLYIHLA